MSYELIETVEVGSGGAASIEFTSIPQDGTDLVVLFSLRSSSSGVGSALIARVNGSSATYSGIRLLALPENPSPGVSSATTSDYIWNSGGQNRAASTSNTFSSGSLYMANYTSSNPKTFSSDSVVENNDTAARLALNANSWSGTSPITSIKFGFGGTFVEHSTVSLYKITAA